MGHTHADHMNQYLKNPLVPYFGDKRLASFTSEDIDRWLGYMVEAPRSDKDKRFLSPTTINHMLICLRHVFNQAKKDGLVAVNPYIGCVRNNETFTPNL